jgi:predicted transcriptional regulator
LVVDLLRSNPDGRYLLLPIAICLRVMHYAANGEWTMKAHRITVNLDADEYEVLVKIAERSDRSMAWIGRRAILDFIASRERTESLSLAGMRNCSASDRKSAR